MLDSLLRLVTDELVVVVTPHNGCDIVSLVDRRTGVDVLWKSPWGRHVAAAGGYAGNSSDYWLRRLRGGWNLLLPHAGAERTRDGALVPFHGEAGTAYWTVEHQTTTEARLSTTLLTAPLTVRRQLEVQGDTLWVIDAVVNDSPDAVSISWGHHPTFGPPLIAAQARLEIDARVVVLDADMHPTGGLGDRPTHEESRWPIISDVDLSVVPTAPRAMLAYLSELTEGKYRIINDQLNLGVELTWPLEVFSHVWLWQELQGSTGYPWFRRAYAMAVEPQSTAPQGGEPTILLAGYEERTTQVTARVFAPSAHF